MLKKRVYSTRETAEYIGVSYSYLRAIRAKGSQEGRMSPPPQIIIDTDSDKLIRYLKEDLDDWLNTRQERFAIIRDGAAA